MTQQIFEEKTDSIRIELDNQNKLNEELKNCLQNVKTQQNKEVKKLRFELNNVNKFITEKQMRFNEDKKRLNAEIVRLEGIISQKDISNKKIYENKLIKFVESIEEKIESSMQVKYVWFIFYFNLKNSIFLIIKLFIIFSYFS